MKSRDVHFWAIKVNKKADDKRSYTVRWTVAGQQKSGTFDKRALAENHRSDLMQAANRGELFETESGLPESMVRAREAVSWLEFARAYIAMKWPHAAAKTRDSMTEALATVAPAFLNERASGLDPELVRRTLRVYVLIPNTAGEPPADVQRTIRTIEGAAIPVTELNETGVIRRALDELALKLDRTPAAATTMRRKRTVVYNLLQYAVELELLPANPLDRVRSKRRRVAEAVDRRVVINPRQARELLAAVTYVGRGRGARLRAFFGCIYFGALRPAEALALRDCDCELPAQGWGNLTLVKSRPQASKRYTDSGDAHDERSLKHRAEDEPRSVPIPPELVALLREHIDTYNVAPDGRLFRSEAGNVVGASTYSRVWKEARLLGMTPSRVDSPMAGRPYDLRHAAVSLWLNGGVPATEVAERAGHSVDVLLKVYAKCIDGQADLVNQRIEAALAA